MMLKLILLQKHNLNIKYNQKIIKINHKIDKNLKNYQLHHKNKHLKYQLIKILLLINKIHKIKQMPDNNNHNNQPKNKIKEIQMKIKITRNQNKQFQLN